MHVTTHSSPPPDLAYVVLGATQPRIIFAWVGESAPMVSGAGQAGPGPCRLRRRTQPD